MHNFIKQIIILPVTVLLAWMPIKGQEEQLNIDSLANVFIQSPSIDLQTFDLLFIELHALYPVELAHMAEILLERSIKENRPIGIYRAYDAYGYYLLSRGLHQQALKLFLKSKKYYETHNLLSYKTKNYYYLGRLYMAMGNNDEAVIWVRKSLSLAELGPDRSKVHNLRVDLAAIYFASSKYEHGKKLLDENYKEWDDLEIIHRIMQLKLYGNYYIYFKDYDRAKEYYIKALDLSIKSDNPIQIADAYTNLAIYQFEYDVQESKRLFEKSLYFAHLSNSPSKISTNYYNLASWYYGVGNLDSAYVNFDVSYRIAESSNLYQNMVDALDEMLNIRRDQNDFQKVDELHQKIQDVKAIQYEMTMKVFDEISTFDSFVLDGDQKTSNQKKGIFATLSTSHYWVILLVLVVLAQTGIIIGIYKSKHTSAQ